MSVYAYMCSLCDHPASRHLLARGGDRVAGPYRCQHCECSCRQDDPTYTFDRTQFEEWERQVVSADTYHLGRYEPRRD